MRLFFRYNQWIRFAGTCANNLCVVKRGTEILIPVGGIGSDESIGRRIKEIQCRDTEIISAGFKFAGGKAIGLAEVCRGSADGRKTRLYPQIMLDIGKLCDL